MTHAIRKAIYLQLWFHTAKDTNQNQPEGETHKVRSGRVPNAKRCLSPETCYLICTLKDDYMQRTASQENCCPEFLLLFSPNLCDLMDCSMLGFPVPSRFPRACSNSCPLSQWCHPIISSFTTPSPPALNLSQHQGFFPVSWLFVSGG